MNPVLEALFGNRTAACVLMFLQCYGEGHAQRIARTFDFGLNMTQRQLKRLEEQGVLVSRRLGNMRLFSFNERNPTVRNLRKLLEAELAALPEEDQQQYFRERQRPRQSNKPLVMTSPDDGITMRTIVDLPDRERAQLDALCRQRGLSRAEAMRQALRLWLSQQQPGHSAVFGLWRDRPEDSVALQQALRAEWSER